MSSRHEALSPGGLTTYGRSHAVRHPGFEYRGGDATIHVTLCAQTPDRLILPEIRQMVCESIEKSASLCEFRLFGFCLMPDQAHILISLEKSSVSLGDWLRRFKSFTTNQAARFGAPTPLWQRSAYDHICRKLETAEIVLAYIVNNPVRANLAHGWREWPWTRVFIELG